MYYRRKIILSLLRQFDNSMSRLDFQKLLFLFSQNQKKTAYHFVPYKYGCYSFQANQDVLTLGKYGLIEEKEDKIYCKSNQDYRSELSNEDRLKLIQLHNSFSDFNTNELIMYVYRNYPYYAINSVIAGKIMNDDELLEIKRSKPDKSCPVIVSIGYEGRTIEEYTNVLLANGIKVLFDVRKNAFSMKYGFSKKQLINVFENIGISYIHVPELGIDSNKRKKLNSPDDYRELFHDYEINVLDNQIKQIDKLVRAYKKYRHIALLCFEADPEYCHRTRILNRLLSHLDDKCEIVQR
ncbi:MAG: DUF488 family protein [Candidatus Kapaibacterium sp.]